MNRVKFSADWDKLDGPRFTTVRTYRPEKHAYYQSKVGEKFTILRVPHEWSYKGRKIGEATLRSVSVVVPGELPALEIQREVSLGGSRTRSGSRGCWRCRRRCCSSSRTTRGSWG